jgi:hypothetical protein
MDFEGPIAPKSGESESWKYQKGVAVSYGGDMLMVKINGKEVMSRVTMPGIFKPGDEVYLDPRGNVYKDIEKRGPEYGNPNKVIPAFEEIIEVGAVTVIKDDAEQTEYKFAGKELNGIMTMKKESPASDIYVFSKGDQK